MVKLKAAGICSITPKVSLCFAFFKVRRTVQCCLPWLHLLLFLLVSLLQTPERFWAISFNSWNNILTVSSVLPGSSLSQGVSLCFQLFYLEFSFVLVCLTLAAWGFLSTICVQKKSLKIRNGVVGGVFKSDIWKSVSLQDFYFGIEQEGKLIPSAAIVWIRHLQAVSAPHETD